MNMLCDDKDADTAAPDDSTAADSAADTVARNTQLRVAAIH